MSQAGAMLAAGGIWSVSFHCPAHWLVGRAIGIRFTDYFLGGPPPPRESYLDGAAILAVAKRTGAQGASRRSWWACLSCRAPTSASR